MPEEVLPFLEALMETKEILVYMKFRPYRDGFETWLNGKYPEILSKIGEDRILRSDMKTSISQCDVVIGSHSTAVIESILQEKPFVFFNTKKWGDYFDMESIDTKYKFFARSPEELIDYVHFSRTVHVDVLKDLQRKFFGDPYQNGSKWAVDELVVSLDKCDN
jgi:hypothetical protein